MAGVRPGLCPAHVVRHVVLFELAPRREALERALAVPLARPQDAVDGFSGRGVGCPGLLPDLEARQTFEASPRAALGVAGRLAGCGRLSFRRWAAIPGEVVRRRVIEVVLVLFHASLSLVGGDGLRGARAAGVEGPCVARGVRHGLHPIVHQWAASGPWADKCVRPYVQLLWTAGRPVVVLVEPLRPERQLRWYWGQEGLERPDGAPPRRWQSV